MGYDAGKKVKGRKIHALVDTLGLPIRLVVHSAAVQDRDGAALLLDKVRRRFPWLECVFADGGYDAQQTYEAAAANHPLRLEVVRRNPHTVGFEVIKRRWVVERTFSWFGRNRRLAKDYENLAATVLYLALIETRPGALDHVAALQGWDLAPVFQHLRHLMEARMPVRRSKPSSR